MGKRSKLPFRFITVVDSSFTYTPPRLEDVPTRAVANTQGLLDTTGRRIGGLARVRLPDASSRIAFVLLRALIPVVACDGRTVCPRCAGSRRRVVQITPLALVGGVYSLVIVVSTWVRK